MDTPTLTNFVCEPDQENPGWSRWIMVDPARFNGAVLGRQAVRAEGPMTARLRMWPTRMHTNAADRIHGGVTLALADVSMFAALYVLRGVDAGRSVTVDLSTQFIGGGDPARPLDAVVELLRETRRMAFLRGLVVQDDSIVASFAGTVRKPASQ